MDATDVTVNIRTTKKNQSHRFTLTCDSRLLFDLRLDDGEADELTKLIGTFAGRIFEKRLE